MSNAYGELNKYIEKSHSFLFFRILTQKKNCGRQKMKDLNGF